MRRQDVKIWYQSYSPLGKDPRWKNYEESLKSHARKVARADTEVEIHGVERMAPRMVDSDYIMYLHVAQIIDNALQAEQKGCDAFVVGGTLDPGAAYLRELLDIPVTFLGESAYYAACLLAPRFSLIASSEAILRAQTRLIGNYGLSQRLVPGIHLDVTSLLEIADEMNNNPKKVVTMVTEKAAQPIGEGAGALVVGPGILASFLTQQGVREINGVPIVDGMAAVIKAAEMLVDFKKMGISRGKKGFGVSPVSKEELLAARKVYGVE